MTLMPVSNIWSVVDCSSKLGAVRWIGRRISVSTGPCLSTGSPRTLRMRPRVCLPTGMVTGAPVEIAFMPRTRPSVGCKAMQRTRPSPVCWATSTVMWIGSGTSKPSLVMRIAVWMTGICSGANWMSTAGPATWITFPSTSVAVALDMMFPYSRAAAPLTTSMISLVILAWRTRFMYSVSLSITSLALDVAASMAVMRAACSAAADSRKA
jgi:hypothetical protein